VHSFFARDSSASAGSNDGPGLATSTKARGADDRSRNSTNPHSARLGVSFTEGHEAVVTPDQSHDRASDRRGGYVWAGVRRSATLYGFMRSKSVRLIRLRRSPFGELPSPPPPDRGDSPDQFSAAIKTQRGA
jgi:hypothetical protein